MDFSSERLLLITPNQEWDRSSASSLSEVSESGSESRIKKISLESRLRARAERSGMTYRLKWKLLNYKDGFLSISTLVRQLCVYACSAVMPQMANIPFGVTHYVHLVSFVLMGCYYLLAILITCNNPPLTQLNWTRLVILHCYMYNCISYEPLLCWLKA